MIKIRGMTNCEDLAYRRASNHALIKISPVAQTMSYRRMPPVYVNTHYATSRARNQTDTYFLQLDVVGRPIEIFEFPNALQFGQGSVVLHDDMLVHDSAAEFINHGLPPAGSIAIANMFEIQQSVVQRLPGRTLLVKRPWYANFGHWLVDLLPIIPMAVKKGIGFDNVLFGEIFSPALRDLMEGVARAYCPGANLIFANDDAVFQAETLLYTRPIHVPPLFKHPRGIHEVRAYGQLVTQPRPVRRRRLYVTRQHIPGRGITNAEALEAILRSYEFELIVPEMLSFAEQVRTFAEAEIVVGVKGAALTNVVFCEPGSALIVLTPSDFPDPFFWDLVSPLHVRYAEIFCQVVASSVVSASVCDFIVDTAMLNDAFRAINLQR